MGDINKPKGSQSQGPRTIEDIFNNPKAGDRFETYFNGAITIEEINGDVLSVSFESGGVMKLVRENFREFFRSDAEAALNK